MDWDELLALPRETVTVDIHCVTQWTKFDTTWTGVSLDMLLAAAGPRGARYAVAHAADGYETNLPLADLTGGRAWLVWEYEGAPLQPPHGGPARLLVPHLYFWKSAKWVRRSSCSPRTGPATGRSTATTTVGTHGWSSGIRGTERDRARGGPSTVRRSARRRRACDDRARRARLGGPPRGPERRRPPHRR